MDLGQNLVLAALVAWASWREWREHRARRALAAKRAKLTAKVQGLMGTVAPADGVSPGRSLLRARLEQRRAPARAE